MLDLVVNHTSDQHPWFQAARSDPDSPFRDWYVWSATEPPDRFEGMVFPGVEKETWTYDEMAAAWYRHRFYRFEPDLNTDNPTVREEIRVESQQQDPGSTLAFVRRLTHLRSREAVLQSGTQHLVSAGSGVFCYERELDRRFLVALNFRSDRVPLALGDDTPGPAFLELSTHPGREHGAVGLRDFVLEPDEGLILRLSEGGEGRS